MAPRRGTRSRLLGSTELDFLAIFPLVTAIVLHDRRHDAAGATALAIATAAKLFPLVVLPVVLAVRLAERRVRAALTVAGPSRRSGSP